MRIHILVCDKVFDTGLATLLDTFSIANELGVATGSASKTNPTRFDVTIVGVRKRVRTNQGLLVPVVSVDNVKKKCPDIVLVPAIGAKMPTTLRVALQRRDIADACALLRQWAGQGAITGAACTGTFVLAKAGLLDGETATTSWWLAPLFREFFPLVTLNESQMLVTSARCITAGAALAHLDLALSLVRKPRISRDDGALPGDGSTPLTSGVRDSRSSRAQRSNGGAIRALGPNGIEERLFARRCRTHSWHQ